MVRVENKVKPRRASSAVCASVQKCVRCVWVCMCVCVCVGFVLCACAIVCVCARVCVFLASAKMKDNELVSALLCASLAAHLKDLASKAAKTARHR